MRRLSLGSEKLYVNIMGKVSRQHEMWQGNIWVYCIQQFKYITILYNNMTNDKFSLGYWTDNGAYYYYKTMNNLNYEDTLIQLHQEFQKQNLPIRYVEVRIQK